MVEAWKKLDELHADDAIRKNTGAVEALSKPHKSRPSPSDYLDKDYIDNHLKKFDDGAVRFTTDGYATLGLDDAFVMPKSEFDKLMKETGGDLTQIEKKLGLKSGKLADKNAKIAWIKKEDCGEIKIPSGNERGADADLWIPGGKTSGGYSEGIMDLSNKNIPHKLFPF